MKLLSCVRLSAQVSFCNIQISKLLCSNAKTRRLSDSCNGILRKANPQVCRAGGLQPKEMVCQRHFDKIRREYDRRCSCLSTWEHSSKLHSHAIPHHFFPTVDQAGFNFPNYQPGTRQCNKCRSEAPQRIQNWPKSDNRKTSPLNVVNKIIRRLVSLIVHFL